MTSIGTADGSIHCVNFKWISFDVDWSALRPIKKRLMPHTHVFQIVARRWSRNFNVQDCYHDMLRSGVSEKHIISPECFTDYDIFQYLVRDFSDKKEALLKFGIGPSGENVSKSQTEVITTRLEKWSFSDVCPWMTISSLNRGQCSSYIIHDVRHSERLSEKASSLRSLH